MSIYEYSLKIYMNWEKEVYMVMINLYDFYEIKDNWYIIKEYMIKIVKINL